MSSVGIKARGEKPGNALPIGRLTTPVDAMAGSMWLCRDGLRHFCNYRPHSATANFDGGERCVGNVDTVSVETCPANVCPCVASCAFAGAGAVATCDRFDSPPREYSVTVPALQGDVTRTPVSSPKAQSA